MLVYFRQKQEFTTRNYDFASSGFAQFSPSIKNENSNQPFVWNLSLIKDLAAIYSSIFISALGYGILMVMIAIRLNANVKSEILMSICAATQIGAGVIFARFLPMLGSKMGMIRSIYIGSIISAIASLFLFQYFGYLPFLFCIYLLGTSLFICGVTRNTIMIDLAPSHIRTIIISIGTMLVAIGNSLGPIILSLTKTNDNFYSFLLAAAFFLLSILPLARLKKVDSNVREEKKLSLWRYMTNSPKIMLAGFTVSYSMSASSAFSIIYGLRIGMNQQDASLLLSTLLFGTILYLPLGYLCDFLNRRFLMIISAVFALICLLHLYFDDNLTHIYTMLFLMFGCLAGVKLPAIVLINEKYKPTQRLAVNSAFSRVSLSGNICGLLISGFIMKNSGPKGLWLSLALMLSIFLAFCLANYLNKFLKKELNLAQFSIFNKNNNEEISKTN